MSQPSGCDTAGSGRSGADGRHGWVVHGLDVSAQAIEVTRWTCSRSEGSLCPLEHAGLPDSTFDMIALWDVIEHVDDPEALLRHAYLLLRPRGMLVMETPDEGCLARVLVRLAHRATGGRVSLLGVLYYPGHRWYFSRRAMRIALQRVGFDRIQFYGEQTVREFGQRKLAAYKMVRTWFHRAIYVIGGGMRLLPWLRNKMVVVAIKSQ